MRVTIIRPDNTISVDGVQRRVDCSKMPGGFHVLQWYGEYGELEYASQLKNGQMHKEPNRIVKDLEPYRAYVDAWHAAGGDNAS